METVSASIRKFVHSLGTTKGRRAEGAFVAEGTKSVRDTLPRFNLRGIYAVKSWWERNAGIDAPEDKRYVATPADMERMTSLSTAPEVIAVYDIPKPESFRLDVNALVIALDAVQDPGNLGTIVRLCDWFGITDILAGRDTVDIYNPKTVMATMGSIGRVRVHYVDLTDVLADARHRDIPVWGTFLDGENIYALPADTKPVGIMVMGNEGKGISDAVGRYVSHRLLIPTYPPGRQGAESLNVAMATAVAVAEFRRRSLSIK